MKTMHLTDQQVQDLVIEPGCCDKELDSHLQKCRYCQQKADAYHLLFHELRLQKEESFDFDISTLVLNQLDHKKPALLKPAFTLILYAMLLVSAGFPALYFTVTSIVTARAGLLSVWLIIITIVTMLLGIGLENYRNYQKRLELLI